jgi:hypothetical protein
VGIALSGAGLPLGEFEISAGECKNPGEGLY